MPEKIKETPDSLLKFFRDLAETTGTDDDGEEGSVDYASPGVARRGLEAAKMLATIQQVMGVKAAAPAPAADKAKETSKPEDAAKIAQMTEMLGESQSEIDRLLMQSMELTTQNKSLKEKVAILQKQVERLYNKNEMAKTLKTIETKVLSPVERLAMDEEKKDLPEVVADSPAPPDASSEQPSDPTAEPAAETSTEIETPAAAEAPAAAPPTESKAAPAKFKRPSKDPQPEPEPEAPTTAPTEATEEK